MISVVALSDPDYSVLVRTYNASASQWNETWESLGNGGASRSAVSICTAESWRPDLWVAAEDAIRHNNWAYPRDDYYVPDQGITWPDAISFGTNITSRPAIACRDDNYIHDLMVYGADRSVWHMTYSNSTSSWSTPFSYTTEFRGDPSVLNYLDQRVDFFGIGTDQAMHHFYYSNTTGHSSMESLGGSFQSVPSAELTGADRIDVLALGMSGTLLHRACLNNTWSPEWEDLGVVGNSAPLLINLDTDPPKLAMFVLGNDGKINQTSWTKSSDLSWKDLSWSSMGGNMTGGYVREQLY